MNELNKIKSIIEDKQYISFDLFDTLVYRAVESPNRVFKIVASQFYKITGKKIDSFSQIRQNIEHTLYIKNGNVTLSEIYKNFLGLTDEDRNKLIEIEQKVEIDLCYPSRIGMELYKYAISLGKDIYINTDMYLPSTCIQEILKKCGYKEIKHDNILVSCEMNSWKANKGDLYKTFLKKKNVKANAVCHIGDNYKNDVVFARLNGIRACLIDNSQYNEMPFRPYYFSHKSPAFNYGFNYFGALTLGYIQWIHKIALKNGLDELYFFSREGMLYKKIFDQLYDDITTKYIYVSRKALKIPLIYHCNNMMELLEIIPANELETIGGYLTPCGLENNEKIKEELRANGYTLQDRIIKNRTDDRLFIILYKYLKPISLKENYNAKLYFEKNVKKNKKIGIIDIGWSGRMQNSFERLLKEYNFNDTVMGFYIGQMPEIKRYLDGGMRNISYLFGYRDERYGILVKSACALLESVYFANHGTTLGYDSNGEQILSNEILPTHTVQILLDVQEGIIEYTSIFGELNEMYGFIRPEHLRKSFKIYFSNPSNESIEVVKDIYHYDEKMVPLVETSKSRHKIYANFMNSAWKPAFLKYYLHTKEAYRLYNTIRIVAKKALG